VEEVDAYDLLLHGIRGDAKRLENGDSLRVPPLGSTVTVEGMVRRPGQYELRTEKKLNEILELAGGILPAAALRHIEVQRLDAHEKRTMLSLEIGEETDKAGLRAQFEKFRVQDGDEIHIFPIAPYNSGAVYLFCSLTPEEDRQVVEAIERSRADIVWVGLGAPKQDRWMFAHRERLSVPVLIGVGAAFDFHTGRVPRAPVWMRENGFEWLFRLLIEPRRLWKRYLVYGSQFVILVALELLGLKKFS
jgi:hypothetical protein